MQLPRSSGWIKSISSPRSSLITVAPVNKARSSSISLLLIPKVGAFIMFTLILPLVLFIASVETTAGSTSAIINRGLSFLITYSKTDCICLTFSTGDSIRSTAAFFNSAVLLTWSVMKC